MRTRRWSGMTELSRSLSSLSRVSFPLVGAGPFGEVGCGAVAFGGGSVSLDGEPLRPRMTRAALSEPSGCLPRCRFERRGWGPWGVFGFLEGIVDDVGGTSTTMTVRACRA